MGEVMEKRQLGNTEINVSSICLGTMTWGRQNTEEEAFAQMDYAYENGINFFDTAELKVNKLEDQHFLGEKFQSRLIRMFYSINCMRFARKQFLVDLLFLSDEETS